MKTADVFFFHGEPPSFGMGLCLQLLRHGVCKTAIQMPSDPQKVLEALRASPADCIVFISPHMHGDFIRQHHAELRAIGKPLIGYVSEWVAGNDVFRDASDFHKEGDWLDYYAATQSSDVLWFRSLGMKSDLAPPMFASELFPAAPADHPRIPELCYIGHNNAWKTERLRVLQSLDQQGLVKGFSAPRTLDGAAGVAEIFRRYAAVVCPPAHGRAHSIRCFEAASSGALIVECQPLDDGNEFFIEGQHRVSFPVGLAGADICDFVRSLDYDKLKGIAQAGCELAHREFRAEVGFSRLLSLAANALTESQ